MNLSKRLNLIISMVPPCDTAADIGTDHGFVPISLVESGKARRAVASDVVPGPLQRAAEHIEARGLSDLIDVRLGSGLSTLKPGEADVIMICGMGGMLIADLLRADPETAKQAKTLILSPHTEIPALRRYLSDAGFLIADEGMVSEDGKFYTVMKASYSGEGQSALSEEEIGFGPVLLEKMPEEFSASLRDRKKKLEQILRSLEKRKKEDSASEHVLSAYEEKKKELQEVQRILKRIQKNGL